MSPLDDELRAALQGRARALEPAPDPLAGIEARARRIQRNRIGAAVAGSALAVAAIAAVVPAIQSASSAPGPRIPQVASAGPETQQPSPAPRSGRPAAAVAWGRPLDRQLDQGYLQQWETMNAKPAGAAKGEVLYRGETNDGVQVHVYQLWFDADTAFAVVAHSSEGGPEIVRGTILEPGTRVIDAVVPASPFPALVVAHDPALPTVQYAPDGRTFRTIEDAEGTGVITERTGPTGDGSDQIRLLDLRKQVAYEGPVFLDDAGQPGEALHALDPDRPWEVRGDPSLLTGEDLDALGRDWAQRHGVAADRVAVQPLYVWEYEVDARTEVVYLVRFADNPWMWGVSSLGDDGWQWYADNELAVGTTALAAALPGDEGVERLLVVAAPSTGGAIYAADGVDYAPMTDREAGIFIHPVSPGDADDRFKVLDGDGDPDRPVHQAPAPDFQNAG